MSIKKAVTFSTLLFSTLTFANTIDVTNKSKHEIFRFSDTPVEVSDQYLDSESEKNISALEKTGEELIAPMLIGGTKAFRNDFSFFARIVIKERDWWFYDICGGSIINDKYILTAAHCLMDHNNLEMDYDMDKVKVLVKNFNRYDVHSEELKSVTAIHIHPDFGTIDGFYYGDIAVLELGTPIVDNVDSMPIATSEMVKDYDSPEAIETTFLSLGMGTTSDNGDKADFLEHGEVDVMTVEDGTNYPVRDNNIKGYGVKDSPYGTGTNCQGDSGSPLLYKTTQGKWQQIGVSSYGNNRGGCEQDHVYSVWTEVAYYHDWVKSIVQTGEELNYDRLEDENYYYSFGDNNFVYADKLNPPETDEEDEVVNQAKKSSGGSTGLLTLLGLGFLTLRRKK